MAASDSGSSRGNAKVNAILLVGSGHCKDHVAGLLKGCGCDVVRTKDFKYIKDTHITCSIPDKLFRVITGILPSECQFLLCARAWISANSLRRSYGSGVKVIYCVINYNEDEEWLGVANSVFERCDQDIIRMSLTYLRLMSTHDQRRELEYGLERAKLIILNKINAGREWQEVKPWSSERVVLFGEIGSGKSTIANMLVSGSLDKQLFKSGDGPKGVTSEIKSLEGRGWRVTDTPGFNEGEDGTLSTEEVDEKLTRFVEEISGVYSHFIYVMKMRSITHSSKTTWKMFKSMYRGAEKNFTVVITNCPNDVSEEDMKILRKTFDGCSNFIHVDFPPMVLGAQKERNNVAKREESLKRLESYLAGLYLADVDCTRGKFSKASRQMLYDTHTEYSESPLVACRYMIRRMRYA